MSVVAQAAPRHVLLATPPAASRVGRHRRAPQPDIPLQIIAVALPLVLIAVVHGVNVNGWPVFGDDEGTYVAQAWAVLQGDLAHYTYWYDHPPAGWIQLAFLQWLPSAVGATPTVASSRIVMLGVTLVTALLIRRLCRNLGTGEAAALAAMLGWGLSPLVVYESRQVLLDNLALPWLIGGFVLVTSPKRSLAHQLSGGVCFGVAVLTKETSLILAPALLLALWTYAYRPTRSFAVMGTAVITVLTGFVYPLFAILRGELIPGAGHVSLIDGVLFQLVERTGSGVIWDSGSAARGVVASWFRHDWILPGVGAVVGLCCLRWRSSRPVGVALTILIVMAVRPNGYLPAMFIIVALPFAAIAAAVVVERLARRLSNVRLGGRRVGLAAAVLAGGAAVTLIGNAWAPRHSEAMNAPANDGYTAALDFVSASLPRSTAIVVDDAYWTSLVAAGWSSDGWHGAIWHYKLDLDPIPSERALPNGWRDVDYVIESETIRLSLLDPGAHKLRDAFDHSLVVAEWGTGEGRVALREVHPEMDLSVVAPR